MKVALNQTQRAKSAEKQKTSFPKELLENAYRLV